MSGGRVHYEVFSRRKPGADWTLEMATEDRAAAVATAEDLVHNVRLAAARVTKETQDEETGEFRSVTILNVGASEPIKAKPRETIEPACVAPPDFYSVHSRERIGQALEPWLARVGVTPFELLHRPDLAEKLEASDEVLQHAIQKVAVPEALARGGATHALIRAFQSLADRTIARLIQDHRKGVLVNLAREPFVAACERLAGNPQGAYLLGAGVAGALAREKTWSAKVERLLDLAEAAPPEGLARKLALFVVQQPLAEILGARPGIEDLLGRGLDPGAELCALTRLVAPEAVELLAGRDPTVAKLVPEIGPAAARLGRWMGAEHFGELRTAVGKRILRELNGPRRLRPDDAAGEIGVLRVLAMTLTAAAGSLLPLEDVQAAFSTRSKMLVTGDFVDAYLGRNRTAFDEAQALVWLAENVIGAANKRQATRWLGGVIGALRFETEMLSRDQTHAARLGKLAELQRQIGRCGLAPEDAEAMQTRLGDVGGKIEAEVKLAAALARAKGPAVQRLQLLLQMACGVAAPLGPAADRAKTEALRLIREPATRTELAADPDKVSGVMELMQKAGLAA